MTPVSRLAAALLLLPALAAVARAAGPVRARDPFDSDPRVRYVTHGDLDWRPGALRLGPSSHLRAELAGGPAAEVAVTATLGGANDTTLTLLLVGDRHAARADLTRDGKRLRLTLTGYGPPLHVPLGDAGDAPWRVRLAADRGLILAKAWPRGRPEPQDWTAARYLQQAEWRPTAAAVAAGRGGGLTVHVLEVETTPPARRPPAAQALLQRGGELLEEGGRLLLAGDATTAALRFEKALAAFREALPPGDPDLADVLYIVGMTLREQGRLAQARPYLEESLAVRRQTLPALHPDLAESLASLGTILSDEGRYEEAHPPTEQALAIFERVAPPGHPDIAVALNNLGHVAMLQGRLEEARRRHERALEIRRKALPPDHVHLAASLNNLGQVLDSMGRLDDARARLEEALAVYRKAVPRGHPDLGVCLVNLGSVLHHMRRFGPARERYEEGVAIYRKALPPHHPKLAGALSNLGAVLRDQGEGAAARRCHEEAVAIYRKTRPGHPELATALANLACDLAMERRMSEARPLLEEALAICRKTLPPGHPALVITLGNLAFALLHLDRTEEARRLLDEALAALDRELPGVPSRTRALVLMKLALADRAQGKATAWRRACAAHAEAAAEVARLTAGSAQVDHGALIAGRRVFLEVLLNLVRGEMPADFPRDLLAAMLESKAMSAAALHLRREAVALAGDPALRDAAEQLRGLQQELADALLAGPGRGPLGRWQAHCRDLQERTQALERELALRARPFAEERLARRAGPDELARRLPDGGALIEMVRYDRYDLIGGGQVESPAHYAAAVLWRGAGGGAEVRWVPLGEADALDRLVNEWRAAVQAGHDGGKPGEALATRLWRPLAAALPAGTRRLIVAPEGGLVLVPLEALPAGGGKYLIETMQISYVASGRDLMPPPAEGRPAATALVLADPAYDALPPEGKGAPPGATAELPRGQLFRPLPGFAREAEQVTALLRGRAGWEVQAARGAAATEEALRAARRPRLLYCITHGFFLKDAARSPVPSLLRDLDIVTAGGSPRLPSFGADPRLRSGLALAGANRWRERSAKGLSDGLLTALEVENLDLWGTELVVLSACDTGRGEIQVGEGVLGLRRAFQLAGAQTVLASLWKVPDAETEQLMTDTLSRWLKGTPPHEALREAQLAMIRRLRAEGPRDTSRGLAPPLYWAAFICHGNPR